MEHKRQPLANRKVFVLRMVKTIFYALGIIILGLLVGTVGYHNLADLSWIDAIYNASMILGGMGPVNTLNTDAAKLFASGYAIASGVILIALTGIVLTPVFHRIMHRLNLEEK